MEIWEIPLILVTGVFAGFLNTVAGGRFTTYPPRSNFPRFTSGNSKWH